MSCKINGSAPPINIATKSKHSNVEHTAFKIAKAAGVILFGMISLIPTLICAVVDGTYNILPILSIPYSIYDGLKNLIEKTKEEFNNQFSDDPPLFQTSLKGIINKWVVWHKTDWKGLNEALDQY
jgi:restriction endonuclease S subunit